MKRGGVTPIVSFYTKDTPYEEEAGRMKVSAETIGCSEVILYPVQSRGTWEKNCQIKAEIIQQAVYDLNRPFLYVDSDARFNLYPKLFDYQWDCDLAVHYFRGIELLSGTIYVKPTQETKGLLADWIRYNQENFRAWDQRMLDKAIREAPQLKVLRLPPEYCYIFDLSPKHYGERIPVITHYQASRRYKKGVSLCK